MKPEFSLDEFSGKNTQGSNFMKIRPVGAKLFLADGHNEASSRFFAIFGA